MMMDTMEEKLQRKERNVKNRTTVMMKTGSQGAKQISVNQGDGKIEGRRRTEDEKEEQVLAAVMRREEKKGK